MRISSKARYGLASMISMAQNYKSGDTITIVSISERLGISKIYLEQVFSLLKRAELVNSIKGAQGGYQLARAPEEITAEDILTAIEISLFEKTEQSVSENEAPIEKSMHNLVWDKLDDSVSQALRHVTLKDLTEEAERNRPENDIMFYI